MRRDLLDNGDDYKPLSIIGLNDFHGQLDPTTRTYDNGSPPPVGGASQLATMFDEEADRLPGRTLLLSRRRQRRRVTAELGAAPGHGRRSTWRTRGGSTPRRSATTSSTSGSRASSPHEAAGELPVPVGEHRRRGHGRLPRLHQAVDGVQRQRHARRGDRRDGPQHAGARGAQATPRACRSSTRPRGSSRSRSGSASAASRCRSSSSTRAPRAAPTRSTASPQRRGTVRSTRSWTRSRSTSIDLVIAGHTHNIANYVRGRIPVIEGVNAGGSYSVAQLMLRHGDVAWTAASTRSRRTSASRRGPT